MDVFPSDAGLASQVDGSGQDGLAGKPAFEAGFKVE